MSATVQNIERARKLVEAVAANDRHYLATILPWFEARIREQRLLETGREDPTGPPVVLVFRPIGAQWEIGFEHCTRTSTYPHDPRPLQAAHAALAAPQAMDAPPTVPQRAGGPLMSPNALRNALRNWVPAWIEREAKCKPLADAVRGITITRAGLLRYDPDCRAPRILTA